MFKQLALFVFDCSTQNFYVAVITSSFEFFFVLSGWLQLKVGANTSFVGSRAQLKILFAHMSSEFVPLDANTILSYLVRLVHAVAVR